jgi:hypothetical protein
MFVGFGYWRGYFQTDKIIQPSEVTEKKFKALSKWIPQEANAIIVVDIYHLSQSDLWSDLINLGRRKLLSRIEAAGINFKSDIGMMAVFMEIKTIGRIKGPVILIQGGFNQELIIERIKKQALEENLELISKEFEGFNIYSEAANTGAFGTSFAFVALKSGLLAAGKVSDLKWIIDSSSKKSALVDDLKKDLSLEKPVWGRFVISEILSTSIPQPWRGITSVRVEAHVKEDLEAQIVAELSDASLTAPIKTALEGFKALEAIQLMNKVEMMDIIDKIKIEESGKKIIISIPKDLKLLNLILSNEANKTEEVKKNEEE